MSWERFQKHRLNIAKLGFSLDVSRMNFANDYLDSMEAKMECCFEAMEALENGSIANPDEKRMVGHYWLRDASLAPSNEIAQEIKQALVKIDQFVGKVHQGKVHGSAGRFTQLLVIGIGGSALGPQFVGQALGHPKTDKLKVWFFDNTDPDGIDLVLAGLEGRLGETLALVISKSGGTPETRNGMLEAEAAWKRAGLNFAEHAVAVTSEGSKLFKHAQSQAWLDIFPMWDWVGGRTSELATVGLLPAALQGLDIHGMLEGAREMDKFTRSGPTRSNPAAMLALMWYYATDGKGNKDMVILPYKDRLMLFSKYLQQLIMESIGKETDVHGQVVNQGIAVYGNKGSTDQHAYVQQLREGINNFFVTFIEVLRDREGDSIEVESGITTGDYLKGLYLGTRDALHEKGRESITITISAVTPFSVGSLIALYERAVGYYATLVSVNAYHQPGVEAGKKAAAGTLDILKQIRDYLQKHPRQAFTAEKVALQLNLETHTELVFKLLEHVASNPSYHVERQEGESIAYNTYLYKV